MRKRRKKGKKDKSKKKSKKNRDKSKKKSKKNKKKTKESKKAHSGSKSTDNMLESLTITEENPNSSPITGNTTPLEVSALDPTPPVVEPFEVERTLRSKSKSINHHYSGNMPERIEEEVTDEAETESPSPQIERAGLQDIPVEEEKKTMGQGQEKTKKNFFSARERPPPKKTIERDSREVTPSPLDDINVAHPATFGSKRTVSPYANLRNPFSKHLPTYKSATASKNKGKYSAGGGK
jgi:hypothetical protein